MRLPVPRADLREPEAEALVAVEARLTDFRIERKALLFGLCAVAADVASSSSDDAAVVCDAGFGLLLRVDVLGAEREGFEAFRNAHCFPDRVTRLACSSLGSNGHQRSCICGRSH